MIDLKWMENITVNEVSNDLKREEFIRNSNNWKILWFNKNPLISYKQLRGTNFVRIIIPYKSRHANTLVLGIFIFNEYGEVEKQITNDLHSYLLKRVKDLRARK